MATEDDIAARIKELKDKKLVRVRQAYTIAELDSLPEISWQIEEHFPLILSWSCMGRPGRENPS